ncbi:serine protease Do [Mucilaginibacter oryzae]|uniref:Serine protease Do n=1 Tax=Mucilaginibacter oryzae TaxID=468058 RepID=A0A316HHU2_9SPHI|nr:trypsin-like peptidase domain-containing protein [Mucilaginibacter oryzae]PWK79550.1 serine protease Do [Mucilaginibacter oryzae]
MVLLKMMKCVFLILILTILNANAQEKVLKPHQVEKLIKDTYNKVEGACIKLVIRDTLNDRDFGGFSGVIVSQDGLILTAAHSVMPGIRYRVELPNGQKAVATALGRMAFVTADKKLDMAMLKIEEKAKWPFVEMGNSQLLSPGEGCVGISYPGSFFQVMPNVRFGRIIRLDDGYGYIESTCKMEPGDSGGALFDLTGKVIGIRDKINRSENENFDIQINLFRKYWSALQKPIDYKILPDSDKIVPVTTQAILKVRLPEEPLTSCNAALDSAFAVYNSEKDKIPVALATSITGKFNNLGKPVFVSKSSLVSNRPWINYKDKRISLSVCYRDRENDVVVLQSRESLHGLKAIHIDKYLSSDRNNLQIGRLLISPLANKRCKEGIVSTQIIELPQLFSRAQLGALLEERDGKVFVQDIAPSYPAEKYLKIGDQIVSINHLNVSNMEAFVSEIRKMYMSDSVALNIIRDKTPMLVTIIFEEPKSDHVADDYEGKRSKRSDGFKEVFVQDAAIPSVECGGPVYDINGAFVGVNIARHSRTSTVILLPSLIYKVVVESNNKIGNKLRD